jgi:polyvinyl alcohol dehydrogenase (cytochrome)
MRHRVVVAGFLVLFAGSTAADDAAGTAPRDRLVNGRALAGFAGGKTAQDLQPAWKVETGANVTGMPLVDGGVVYAADWDGSVLAVDAASGKVLWKKKVATPNAKWPWHGFAGSGDLDAESVYQASAEGTAYAIDRRTGDVRWESRFAKNPNSGNCGKVLAHGGLLYVGTSSVEEGLALQKGFVPTFVGEVVALDAKSGKEVWRRALTEAPHTGVAVWSGFALDAGTGTLFFTTGNNYTGKGTPMSDAIVAVDAKSGAVKWVRQVTESDVWTMAEQIGPDFDFGAAPQLFDAPVDGRSRALVAAGDKGGAYVACDRATGEIVWRAQVGVGHVGGGIMAEASIRDGRVYLVGNVAYEHKETEKHVLDLACLDAATGKKLWTHAKAQPPASTGAGFLVGGVYFAPSADGYVRGYRTAEGALAWKSDPHASIGCALAADENGIYFGTGIPKDLGGNGATPALHAYRIGPGVPPPPK